MLIIFLKNVNSFCKSYSYFFSKNTCEFDIVLTRTGNILTTKELIKLMMLLTTGSMYAGYPKETICMKSQIIFPGKNKKISSKFCLLKYLPSMSRVNALQTEYHFTRRQTGNTCSFLIFIPEIRVYREMVYKI